MESKIVKIKSDFNNIIDVRNSVKNVFDTLKSRIETLRQIYLEFIKNNKNDIFIFGLDSFHFQTKIIDIEYDDMMRLFLAINNRMYCEYFKLNKIIIDYIKININDKKIIDLVNHNEYPIYKDLEPFKEYDFQLILDIHENILSMISLLISNLNNRENELSIHKTKQSIGLNIDNFITTYNYNINVMREKIYMFITYIEFFHKMHSKYIKRFCNKIQLMYTHVSNDVKIDDSVEISKNKKRELIQEFIGNIVDNKLFKEFKISIGTESGSDVSSDLVETEPTKNENIIEKTQVRDVKKIFKKNVNKLTNILNLSKTKKENIVEKKMTDDEIEEVFNGIEESCDSIINDKNHFQSLGIDFIKNNKNSFIKINTIDEITDNETKLNTFFENVIHKEPIMSEDIIIDSVIENV
jgi:hypothetical protein